MFSCRLSYLLLDPLHAALDGTLAHRLAHFLSLFPKTTDAPRLVGCAQVEPVEGLGEPEVGIDARNHHAEIYGHKLDAKE